MHLDTQSHSRIAGDRIARLSADYDRTPSSGSRTLSRVVFLTIVVAIGGALVVASAQAARVAPTFRQNGQPAMRILVRVQARVPAFRMHAVTTCKKEQKQLCKPAS